MANAVTEPWGTDKLSFEFNGEGVSVVFDEMQDVLNSLIAVLVLHKPVDCCGDGECMECESCGDEWPCLTIVAAGDPQMFMLDGNLELRKKDG